MPSITQNYATGNRRYKAAEIYSPQGVVLHSIGTPQPKAKVLRDLWHRDASPYVTHYVLDDAEIIQCMPNNFRCWHIGSPGNSKWIGIEMCEPSQIKYTSGAGFKILDLVAAQNYTEKCYKNAVWLLALLCANYGWNPYTAILTHNEVSKKMLSNTDHVDPEHLWNGLGMGYDLAKLRTDVAAAIKYTDKPSAAPAAKPQATQTTDANQLYRIRKAWSDPESQIGAYSIYSNAVAAWRDGYAVFDKDGKQVYPFKQYAVRVTASTLNVRKGASTDHAIVQTIEKGGAYTIVAEENGWGLLKAYEKNRNGWVCLAYTERI